MALLIDDRSRTASLSFRGNFSWTFVGNFVFSACSWATLVVLAKLSTPEMVGRFALGLAVTAPILMFSSLQLGMIQATDARRLHPFGDYLGLRLLMTLLALLVITGVALLGGYRRESGLVILAVGAAKAIEAISNVLYGLFQQRERMDRTAISMMIRGITSVLAMAAASYLTGDVLWGVVAMAAAWAAVLVGYDLPSGALILGDDPHDDRLRPRWRCGPLLALTWIALPMGLAILISTLCSSIPRYFLEHYQGERELGLFAAVASLMAVGLTFMSALWQAATPRLANNYHEGRMGSFWRLCLRLFAIGAVLGAAGVVAAAIAGREILTLMFRPEYARRTDLLIWVMITAAVQYTGGILSVAVMAMRRFWDQMPVQVACLVATVLLCAALVPRHGSVGAIWAQLISYVVSRLGFVLLILRDLPGIGRRVPTS